MSEWAEEDIAFLEDLGEALRTQDGQDRPKGPTHSNAWPVYLVQQKVRLYGIDTSHHAERLEERRRKARRSGDTTMNSELPESMRLLVAAHEACRSLNRDEWLAIFYKYNGDSYRGYPEEKWPAMEDDPLGYLAYWSGPHAAEIAKDVWALLLPRMPSEFSRLETRPKAEEGSRKGDGRGGAE